MSKPDLSAAYAASVPDKQQRRLAALAETWERNEDFERLLVMQRNDPASFAVVVKPGSRTDVSLGHYIEARAAAAQLEKETNDVDQ